jgi:hypothetical protein
MSRYRNRLARLCGLAVLFMLAGGAARAGVVSAWDGTGSNDSTSWAGLGADGTTIPAAFSATSTLGIAVSGNFAGSSGLVAVQCPAAACSWTGGFGAGDSLVWAFDNTNAVGSGPLTLGLGTAALAGGVEIQADASGMFDAQVEAFDGVTPLGTTSLSSDVAGDPVFIGIQDTVAEITSLVFSLTSCGGDCNDFAVDTLLLIDSTVPPPPVPEPASMFLLGSALLPMGLMGLGWGRKRRRTAATATDFDEAAVSLA